MWLATTEGFYSVIRWHDGRMCVRARTRADLTRLRKIVPALSKVEVSPGRDYRYRCFCTVDEWAEGASALARTIDYGNFKSAVGRKRGYNGYERALHQVWSIFGRLQPGGPYGFGSKAGYPEVPKGEAKLVEQARETDRRRARPSLASTTKGSSQARLFGGGRDRTGPLRECAECGVELAAGDAAVIDGEAYCKNVGDCVDRARLTL